MIEFDYIRTEAQYLASLELLSGSKELACDTETYCLKEWAGKGGSALDPHTGRISLVILKGRDTRPQVLDILWLQSEKVDFELLRELLISREWVLGHGFKFDLKFMQSTFGWMPTNCRDTLIMAKLCSNATGSKVGKATGHGYADICRDYLDVHITGKKDLRESTWYLPLGDRNRDNEWWLDKLTYAANDVQYLFELHDIMYKVITDPLPESPLIKVGVPLGEVWGLGMQEVLEREFKYLICVARREYIGLPVSEEMMREFQEGAKLKMEELGSQLCIDFDLELPKPDWEGIPKPSPKSLKVLRSSSGLNECIQKALKFNKLDSVQADTLKRILEIIEMLSAPPTEDEEGNLISNNLVTWIDEDEESLYQELTEIENSVLLAACPIMQRVLDFKMMVKQSSMSLLKFINPVTGRIHPKFDQLGASTGRAACSGPNLQQVSGRIVVLLQMERERLEMLFRSSSKEVKC